MTLFFIITDSFDMFGVPKTVSANHHKPIQGGETPNLVGTVKINNSDQQGQQEEHDSEEDSIDRIVVLNERIPERIVVQLELQSRRSRDLDIEQESEYDNTYIPESTPPPIVAGVKWIRDSIVEIPSFEENLEYNIATPNSLVITHGPADIDIISSNFIAKDNVWVLAPQPGKDQVKWEFSKNSIDWTCCFSPDIAQIFELNVPNSSIHHFYFRLKTPTDTSSYSPHGSRISIIVSESSEQETN